MTRTGCTASRSPPLAQHGRECAKSSPVTGPVPCRCQRLQPLHQRRHRRGHLLQVVAHKAEAVRRAVGQNGVNGAHVVGHQPVAGGSRAARIGRPAAEGAARLSGGIDRRQQPVWLERYVQVRQYQAQLHRGERPRLGHF